MDMTEAKDELIRVLERKVEALEGMVAQQAAIIDHHNVVNTWTGALRSGAATLDEFEAALDLEAAGEVDGPLPKGFVRTPEGEIRRAGEVGNEPDHAPPASSASIDETFLGKLA